MTCSNLKVDHWVGVSSSENLEGLDDRSSELIEWYSCSTDPSQGRSIFKVPSSLWSLRILHDKIMIFIKIWRQKYVHTIEWFCPLGNWDFRGRWESTAGWRPCCGRESQWQLMGQAYHFAVHSLKLQKLCPRPKLLPANHTKLADKGKFALPWLFDKSFYAGHAECRQWRGSPWQTSCRFLRSLGPSGCSCFLRSITESLWI
jgi:hypothetical protein